MRDHGSARAQAQRAEIVNQTCLRVQPALLLLHPFFLLGHQSIIMARSPGRYFFFLSCGATTVTSATELLSRASVAVMKMV